MPDDVKVFISYAREDYEIAKKLYDDLEEAGVIPWMDDENLLPGQNWKMGISEAISESDYFIALLSNNSITKKGYVQKELLKALDVLDGYPPDQIYMIPVRIDNCLPKHKKLHELNWVNLFSSYESCFKRILQVLLPEKQKDVPQKPKDKPKHPTVKNPATETKTRRIDCDDHYIAYDNDTVLDTKTGLMWPAKDNGVYIYWNDANRYCETYNRGGYSDWRMPTIEELKSLYDKNREGYKPSVHFSKVYLTPLIQLTFCWVWAFKSNESGQGSGAASFYFVSGLWGPAPPDTLPVLPVRSGNL